MHVRISNIYILKNSIETDGPTYSLIDPQVSSPTEPTSEGHQSYLLWFCSYESGIYRMKRFVLQPVIQWWSWSELYFQNKDGTKWHTRYSLTTTSIEVFLASVWLFRDSSNLCLGLLSCVFPSCFSIKMYEFLIRPHAYYTPSPSYPPWFRTSHPNNTFVKYSAGPVRTDKWYRPRP